MCSLYIKDRYLLDYIRYTKSDIQLKCNRAHLSLFNHLSPWMIQNYIKSTVLQTRQLRSTDTEVISIHAQTLLVGTRYSVSIFYQYLDKRHHLL